MQITSQGMTAQRERLEAASANLANANTTRAVGGGPYRRRDIVLREQPIDQNDLSQNSDSFQSSLFTLYNENTPSGVQAATIIGDGTRGELRFQPNHPDADANGYVRMPDVDPLEESVNIISATRSFEANATAFNTAKELARASLKLSEI
jgi:flagellar basal-body rod protein FlgC